MNQPETLYPKVHDGMAILVEMTGNRILGLRLPDGSKVFPHSLGQRAESLSNIEHVTVGTSNDIHYVGGGASEGPFDSEAGFGANNLENIVQVGTSAATGVTARVGTPQQWKASHWS